MKPKNSFKPDSIGAYFRMEWLRSAAAKRPKGMLCFRTLYSVMMSG